MIEQQLEYIPIIFSADNMMPEIPTPAAEATSSSKPIIFSLTERTWQAIKLWNMFYLLFSNFDPFLIHLLLYVFPVFEQKQRRTLSVCLSIYRIPKKIFILCFNFIANINV